MPELIKLRWTPQSGSGLPRSARRGCDYEAYVPDLLADRIYVLSGETAADVADAERAVQRLNQQARGLADSEAIARLLLRAEAVASSKIEGLEIGGRRLLRAQTAIRIGEQPGDITAVEVLNNIEAMHWAIGDLTEADAITVEDLLGVHERLLAGTLLERHAGRIRDQQNWIGGSSYNPCSASFVPPPAEHVRPLLKDLCAFCNRDTLPTIAQAAIAHAQFETIHPFIDGNGRTGRALIHMIMRRRGLASVVVPPVSLVLATRSEDYINGLAAARPRETELDGTDAWIATFAAAVIRAVDDAEQYEQRVADLQAAWLRRLGRVRSDSAVVRLIDVLPGAPVVTAQTATALVGRSLQAVNEALPRLVDAGILRQITVGRRNRAFEAPELLDAFNDLERQLASPDGDTSHSPPVRRVPYRRSRRNG